MSTNKKLNRPVAAIMPRGIESSQSFPGSSQRLFYVECQSSGASAPSERSIAPRTPSERSIAPSTPSERSFIQDSDEDSGLEGTDNTLLSMVTSRLYEVESKLARYKEHIDDLKHKLDFKEAKIQLLMQKLQNREKLLQDVKNTETNSNKMTIDKLEYAELQERCATLRRTVEEMNQFFSDYGVMWVGEAGYQRADEFAIDFQKLINSIDELNLIVKEGEGHLVYTSQGATFKMAESVPLTLFSNGLMLFSGPFRDYNDPATKEFVQDILDGFFPSELQRSYPDGVPFKVIDKHEIMFEDPRRKLMVFGGVGQRLGGVSSVSSVQREQTPTPYAHSSLKQDISRQLGQGEALDHPRNLKSLSDVKTKEAKVKCLSSLSSGLDHLSGKALCGITTEKPSKLTRQQMGKKSGEAGLPVPVKRSSAHTNIPQTVSTEKHSQLLKKIPLNKLKTADEGVENTSKSSLLDNKLSLISSRKYLTNTNNQMLFQNNSLYGDTRKNLKDCHENYPYSKSTVRTFSSCSTVTSEHPLNSRFPKESKCTLQKCHIGSIELGDAQFSCLGNQNNASVKCESVFLQRRVSVDDFLKKLPSVVVRGGKLIDIRGGIADKIQAAKPSGPTYYTIKFDDNNPRIKLKIHSVDGEKVYVVHISPLRKLGELRKGLDEIMKTNDGETVMNYMILNANVPSKVTSLSSNHNHLSLEQLGIDHSAVLHLHRTKGNES